MINNYNEFILLESKKSQEKFFKDVDKLIKEYGKNIKNDENRMEYDIDTIIGKYTVAIHKSDTDSKVYSIFGKFEDVDEAKKNEILKEYGLNINSGKLNFHEMDAITCLSKFKKLIEKIIKK